MRHSGSIEKSMTLEEGLKQNIIDMIKVCGIGFVILVIYLNLLMCGY